MISSGKLVFITSLERSGSTLLDLTLGRHPDLISFGEVARVLLPHSGEGMDSVYRRPCSCGAEVHDCQFWGPLTREIGKRESALDLTDRYRMFLEVFWSTFGPTKIPVDSSKFFAAMEALSPLRESGLDIKVLFTVRDVRGWVSSCRRAEARKRELPYGMILRKEILTWWRPYLRHNILRRFPLWFPLEWYVRNLRLMKFLDAKGFSTHRLSYERLALDTAATLRGIFDFIGLPSDVQLAAPTTHIVRGNRMAFDGEKVNAIRYDSKWLSELWTQYEPMFWPFIMAANNKWVYSSAK